MRHGGIIGAALALFFSAGGAIANTTSSMVFYEAVNGGNCVTCHWIVADGVISVDTAKDFMKFLADRDLLEARGLNIHLNSPGGSLIGGILLGQTIRDQQANTVVSASRVEATYDSGVRRVSSLPPANAECASACAFAFAGGVSRYASVTTPGSAIGFQEVGRVGVHQFYDAAALKDPATAYHNAEDRIADQKVISILLGFLSEMGVSAELLQLAAMTDPRSMHYLSEEELRRTGMDSYMLKDVLLTGYPNGVAITEVTYRRRDGNYRLEIYCDSSALHMLASIDWRGHYDIDAHRTWSLFDGVSLKDGGDLTLVSEEFRERADGGISGKLHFRFDEPISNLVKRKRFSFSDWSSRYANNSATSMSFTLPENFDGLHILPRTCL